MSQVQFEDNDFHIKSRRIFGEPETPTMIKFLLNRGFAKNEKQALYILISVIIVALLISVFLTTKTFSSPTIVKLKDGKTMEVHEYVRKLREGSI